MPIRTLVLATVLGIHAQSAVTPEDALRRSLERRSGVNVVAILEQLSPRGDSAYVRLKMWRDASGKRRTEILSPVDMQGQVSVDDGTTWTTYFPDARRIRSHPSTLLAPDDLDTRFHLLRRNYRLEIDEHSVVAGRNVIRVVASPRTPDLETRRFYIDAATFVPLKAESVNELGGVTVQFAVRHIEFPARFDKNVFETLQPAGARYDKAQPPVPLHRLDEAERRLGFRAVYPTRLPMGFRPLGMEAVDWHGMRRLAIRLTDGLVPLFVYQSRPSDNPPPPPRPGDEQKTFRDVGDLRVEVRGDAPIAVRERILSVYAHFMATSRLSPP